MPRSLIRVTPIRKILTATDRDVMCRLSGSSSSTRNLKLLELNLRRLPRNKVLDEVSEHYRAVYSLRRSFATLLEVDSDKPPTSPPRPALFRQADHRGRRRDRDGAPQASSPPFPQT